MLRKRLEVELKTKSPKVQEEREEKNSKLLISRRNNLIVVPVVLLLFIIFDSFKTPRTENTQQMTHTAFFSDAFVNGFIPVSAIVGIIFALWMWKRVSNVKVTTRDSVYRGDNGRDYLLEEEASNETEVIRAAADIQDAISEGANSFLFTEYKYMAIFMAVFAVIMFLFLGSNDKYSFKWSVNDKSCALGLTSCAQSGTTALASVVSFLLGAATSIMSGYLGMKIATYANARTALEARKGVAPAFMCAFRSGAVMGFLLTSLGLIVLFLTLLVYRAIFTKDGVTDWGSLFETITGYGLGGSSIALFGRVGGGIYTKAADVGADLVGKVEQGIPEDDPRNPATIADNVGDNVGDIAGMGADLFGSFAEATCAALVVASLSSLGSDGSWKGLMFPLLITGAGILVCLGTTLLATDFFPAKQVDEIEKTLKMQLIISTLIMTPVSYFIAAGSLPATFSHVSGKTGDVTDVDMFWCVAIGLWAGLAIGLVTEYYTSNAYDPVKDVADSCKTGAATNIIFGLALGYKSCIVPIFCISGCVVVSYTLAGFFGVACSALGMLGTLSTGLAIDAYGPIADNAGGIAEMAKMGSDIRERTDALDAAGNTTAAIGKGFAIGSAALVSFALFGAFITRCEAELPGGATGTVNLLEENGKVFVGLLVGAMLPYWFSAMTMKSVGKAALAMVEEVRRQFNSIAGIMEGTTKPDYNKCVEISTDASLSEMIAPGILVMITPLITGIFFGYLTLAGLLIGGLVSGVQMAISMSNTGGAWDNAKKYIEAQASEHARSLGGKGTEVHMAAVVGDTVGDPLKDTSGPALNILMKLMAVESLVFAPAFMLFGDGKGLVYSWFHN